jgi:uncharacterized protein (TIGR02996 family)
MEERALYRAIMAAPHDDAVRLAYADWLDEHADTLPHPAGERARAEFIRLQCVTARRTAIGWLTPGRGPDPGARERRLLFHHSRKWRGAFSPLESSAPFDRGFLRPHRALTPQHFLRLRPMLGTYWPFQPLPLHSPVRRYVPEDDPFDAAPLWDVHLYAPDWLNHPLRDTGQYADLLAEVAQSPALQRVGWLKVSFHRTSTFDFLRHGRFDNVETLVLNSGPFPGVLEAVALNESFRSLRYIQFGTDRWAWAPDYAAEVRFAVLKDKIDHLNSRHVEFGAMRAGLLRVLQTTPLTPAAPPPPPIVIPPLPRPIPPVNWPNSDTAGGRDNSGWWGLVWVMIVMGSTLLAVTRRNANDSPKYSTPQPIQMPAFKAPEMQPFDWKKYSQFHDPAAQLKQYEELQALVKKMNDAKAKGPGGGMAWPNGTLPPLWQLLPERPTAPPPRPVVREVAPPPRAVEPDEK